MLCGFQRSDIKINYDIRVSKYKNGVKALKEITNYISADLLEQSERAC